MWKKIRVKGVATNVNMEENFAEASFGVIEGKTVFLFDCTIGMGADDIPYIEITGTPLRYIPSIKIEGYRLIPDTVPKDIVDQILMAHKLSRKEK